MIIWTTEHLFVGAIVSGFSFIGIYKFIQVAAASQKSMNYLGRRKGDFHNE